MPEPIEELEILRRTNNELVQKNATRKARIAELEASVADITTKLTASNGALHQIRVEQPMQAMAESISVIPELFTREFAHHFKLEFADGKLSLLSTDGKPLVDAKGKSVPFERLALMNFLTEGDEPRAKIFRSLVKASLASGAAGPFQTQQQQTQRKPAEPKPVRFGLR
jgi:hypothetical protein